MQRRSFLQLLSGLFPLLTTKVYGATPEPNGFTKKKQDENTLLFTNKTNITTTTTHTTYTNVQMQQESMVVKGLHQETYTKKAKTKAVKLTTLKVAGLQYGELPKHPFLADERVTLIRQPNNDYDKYAVAIYYMGMHVGYIPRTNSRIIASMLDAGVVLRAHVRYYDANKEPWERLWVSVWMGELKKSGYNE